MNKSKIVLEAVSSFEKPESIHAVWKLVSDRISYATFLKWCEILARDGKINMLETRRVKLVWKK
ncbi:MAG: hypothetical protein DRP12_00290 [Candidatus Aenigmatarchaeota archaeon]|nr:MAG: hypothetical protein DRP12_00290 [Candidatus Aenigmarchaeota archaeon]